MVEFIEEWFIEQTLGEGAFGEVKLLLNHRTGDQVALKVINIKEHPDAAETVQKEVGIHKLLNHENIIKFFGCRKEAHVEYLFLEYASGGELFDQIEPDIGMSSQFVAQNYFRQIISAVQYLHSRGITHRDLKPENILLNNNVIKLSDFGFATIFRKNGIERLLDKSCGTMPYVAPEVLTKSYKAAPADLWSCGIILVAMLAGELPWDRPLIDCPDYKHWREGSFIRLPWSKLDLNSFQFIKRLLNPLPSKRMTLEQLLNHSWMTSNKQNINSHGTIIQSTKRTKKSSDANLQPSSLEDSISRLCSYSQPEPRLLEARVESPVKKVPDTTNDLKQHHLFSFSQPVESADEFFIKDSQLVTRNPAFWVKRMTRFCVSTSPEKTIKLLLSSLDPTCTWKLNTFGSSGIRLGPIPESSNSFQVITITTVDRRKNTLVFKANLLEMNNNVLLDFRLSRGDGLEFKRHFLRIKEAMSDVRLPMIWPENEN